MFLSTVSLLTAVKGDLSARRYVQTAPDQAAALSIDSSKPLLFEKVAFYSNRNIERALQDLRIMASRICLVVPIGDDYANEKKGTTLTSKRATDFMLMISDKDFSIDKGGLVGSYASPGLLNLKDLSVQALTQKSFTIDNYQVAFEPGPGGVISIDWKDKGSSQIVARECWSQVFRADASINRTSFGRT